MSVILCFTGMPGSGKSTATELLEKKGLKRIIMGDAVRKEMREKGLEINNETLRNYVMDIRKNFGDDYVLKLVDKEIRLATKDAEVIVLDGVRNLVEIDGLKKLGHKPIVIAIIADKLNRLEKIRSRANESDLKTLEEFEWREKREIGFGVPAVLATADFNILNNGSLKDFEDNVLKTVALALRQSGLSTDALRL